MRNDPPGKLGIQGRSNLSRKLGKPRKDMPTTRFGNETIRGCGTSLLRAGLDLALIYPNQFRIRAERDTAR